MKINTNETFAQLKSRIASTCGIQLCSEQYKIEIKDHCLSQYVVLTERYLTELHKNLVAVQTQKLEIRITSRHPNGK